MVNFGILFFHMQTMNNVLSENHNNVSALLSKTLDQQYTHTKQSVNLHLEASHF